MQTVLRPGERREDAPTRAMVGVHVGIEHVRDPHALRGRELDVRVHVGLLRIDDTRDPEPSATEHVCRTPGLEAIERLEDHDALLSVSIGSPAARHSATPSSEQVARRPRFVSSATACTA